MVKDQDSEDHVKISLESTYSEAPNIVLSSTKCTYMTDFIFCTSTVSIETSFDFEDKKTHNISLLATDTLGKVSVLNVSLAIIDINDPPSTLLIDEVEYLEIEVPENELDFRIGELSVLDDEKTDKHEFKVTESASGLFRLEGNSLKTSKTRALDFERKDAYYLVITVTDNGEPIESSNFNVTVRIKDVNEAPSSTVLSNNKIVENIPAGSVVGTLTTSDPDNVIADKQQFTYTLSDDSLGRFILQGNTLLVRNSPQSCGASRCVLDYEEEPSVTVKVITVDDGEPRMHREDKCIIHLEDTNDPPTDIRIDGNMIKENQPAGSLIGTLTATDVDGDTITYILKNFVDVFDIQDGNHLVTRTSLDYERLNNYRLLILASDNGNHQGETEETLAIHVIDVNEPPVFLNVSNTMTVREDTEIGRPVVTWAISDPDSGEDIVIFLTDHSNTFSVTGPVCETTPLTGATDCTMVLYLMATVTDADSFVISIYVSDKEGLTSRQTIQMEIQDVNVKPTDILLNGIPSNEILLPENTRGTVVAVLVAVDRDDEQTHTFEVVSETNSQFEIDGDKLQTKSTANIDFENSTQEMLLEIKVTDSGDPPLSFSKTFVVVVEDVNEAPAGAKLSTNTIPENSPIGTVIGNIGMTDPDNGQLHSLVLVSDGGGRFVLNRDTLQVSDAGEGCVPEGANSCKLNFEEKSEYNIEIEVADTGTPSLVALFTLQIDLTDVNEKPRDIKLTSNKLLIGSATGDSIGVLTVEDEDISQTHIFEAVQSSPFMKISSAGEVTVSDSQSLIEGQILELNIRCTDNGNPPLATTETLQIVAVGTNVVTVAIEAIGETVQVDRNTVEIEEGNNAGDAVAKLVLSYPLTNRNIETKIIKADEYIQTDTVTCNNVGGQSICEVNLITLSSLDYENLKFFDATFESSTDTTRTIDTLRLYVQDKNEAPTGLTFGTGTIRVTENSMNQLLGTFSVTDQDGSDTHVFTIPESENFILTDGGQLFTSPDADIDFETVTSTTISVTVVDKGDLAYTQEFEVSVIDINEAPTGLSLTSNGVPEMSSNGTYIGTFVVSDPDSGQSHTFEILNDVDNRFVTEGSDLLVGDMGSDCITRGGSYCLLDSESKAEFNVTVKVTDNGIKPLSAAFVITIRVMDVNDPPRDISISFNKVLEDTEVGQTVAVLDAADDDLGQTLAFDISNTNYFSINGQNLILSTALDYETATEHQIEIIVMDNGTPLLKTSAVFTIHVVNVNEPPINVMLSPTADSPSPFDIDEPSIEEDMPPLLYIGQLVALDADKNDVIRIESTTKDVVIRNTACIPVSKGTRCTADVRSGHLFDFEAAELVEIAFICTDSGGLQLKKHITLKIIDTNDAPTNIFLNGSDISEIIVPENSRDSLLAKLSVDDNEKDQTYIYTLSGRSSYIMVTDDELWIPSAAVLDFESQKQIPFTIRVTDSGTPAKSFQKDLVLMITDLNEVPSDLYLTSYMIPETANEGYTVGTFVTIDPDTVDSEINPVFSIMLPNADSLFRVEGSSLVVAKPEFDYEKKRYFEEEVVVSDSGEPVMSSTFTLTLEVSDVNEAPTIIDFVGDAVEESVDIGFVVGKLSARDPDQGQTLMFSVTGTDLLSVNGDTVVTLGSMDYEAMKELHFTAIVTDTGSPPLSLEKDFTLPVVDVNEPPKDIVVIDNDKMELSEDSEVDQEIVKLKLFDEDHVERLQLEVVYGMDFFNLNTTGLACSVDDEDGTVCTTSLYLTTKLDYESGQSSIDVSVLARDKGGLILQKTFSFSVANVKEPPIDILLDTTTEFVPENTSNFVVGTLSTVEDDWFESHTYVVVSPWELFTTSGNLLIVKAALDFELQNTYTVSVRSQDNSHRPMFLVKEFEIRVGDLNEAPSGMELIPTEVARTATIDELVAEILVNDPDNTGRPGSQTHICEVSSSEYFQVDNSKLVLKMKSVLPGDVESIQLTIICSDSGEPALNTSFDFILQVVDTVNAPSEITLLDLSGSETVSVEENKVDVVVGQLSIVNLLTKEPIEAVVEFSTSDNSQLFYEVIGDKLRVVKELDFETMSISSVQIAAVGTGISGEMIALTKRFTITVTDVNEPPTGIDVSGSREVRENSKEGTVIGTLVTFDAEQYQSYTYTILGVSYGLSATKADVDMLNAFVIDGDVLNVGKDVMLINYEESDIVSILINSEDSGTPSYNVTVLVRMVVENVKELPTDILLSNSIIAENSPMDTIVGTFSVLAEDGEQHQACEILNLMEVPFKISNSYQLVVADDGLNFEVQTNFIVKISCGDAIQDGARLSFSKTFVVNVTNVNEAPTHLELSKQTVVENNEIGQAVAEIIVADEDSDTLYISIEDQTGGGHFVIEDEKTLVARRGFDYEEGQFYKVTIKAADDQDKFIMKEFEIEILNENEIPTLIQLDNHVVSENAGPRSIVGQLTTRDQDWNQEYTYELDSDTFESGSFKISGTALIVGDSGLDYEATSSYEITITSTDNGSPPKSITEDFLIEILDANDPPTAIIVTDIGTVLENATVNLLVASFRVDDPDLGQRHACSIDEDAGFVSIQMKATADPELLLAKPVDYEEMRTLDVLLSCTDGEYNIKQKIAIPVGDVNEAPTAITLSGSNTVLSDAPRDSVIGTLSVDDEDFGQRHSFTISGQNSDIVRISSDNELILLDLIPVETLENDDPSLKLIVTVADNGEPVMQYSQTITLPVTDVEIPVNSLPAVELNVIELTTVMKKEKVISRLFSANATITSSIQFTLASDSYNAFAIINNTFLVLANDVVNIEVDSFEIVIQVEDVVTLQKETMEVVVSILRDFSCVPSEHNCMENEMCVERNETYFECDCIEDFLRDIDGECLKVDNCMVNDNSEKVVTQLCLNGGTCVDGIDNFSCSCTEDFEGTRCEIDKSTTDMCSPSPCLNEGTCSQNADGSSYSCSCKIGWTGFMCESSIDECEGARCLHGGMCIDKYLTYLCTCEDGWKGLRCEYYSSVCADRFCNDSHVCVGLVSSNRTLCAEVDTHLINLEYEKPETNDIKTFQTRLVYFIINYGGLPIVDINTNRRKREVISNETQVYVVDAEETPAKYAYTFTVLDNAGTLLTRDFVLETLSESCHNIDFSNPSVEVFCPSILDASQQEQTIPPNSSSSAGIIAGIIITILLIVILSVAAVVIWKKQKTNKIEPQLMSENVPVGSRDGYATMPTQRDIPAQTPAETPNEDMPLTVNTSIIQVAPAEECNAYSSVV